KHRRSILARCCSDRLSAPRRRRGVMAFGTAPLLPLPACGERVGVRGPLRRLRLAEAPPHRNERERRAHSDLSPQAGRGERPWSNAADLRLRRRVGLGHGLVHDLMRETRMKLIASMVAALACAFATSAFAAQATFYQLPPGAYPPDVAPAADGTVWYSGQQRGFLGRFDPKTGKNEEIPLGPGAAPHGVIIGPDGAPWLTEGGQNAIARVDPVTRQVKLF